jgi:predicted transcriptional regulator
MNITLSLPDDLVKRVRKIAVDRDTTLTGLVREYLNEVARQEAAAGRKRREREALERTFEQFQFKAGEKTWKRADLHERS